MEVVVAEEVVHVVVVLVRLLYLSLLFYNEFSYYHLFVVYGGCLLYKHLHGDGEAKTCLALTTTKVYNIISIRFLDHYAINQNILHDN